MGDLRLSDYKKDTKDRQERRRLEFLQNQEKKRNQLLDDFRKTISDLNDPEDDQPEKKTRSPKQNGEQLGKMLMLSEWMVHPPIDFESDWMFMFCPEGRRCIVIARNGKTMAVTKKGKLLKEFPSGLPGGGPKTTNNRNGTTMLDCVFSKDKNSFYILDILHWGDFPLVDTNTDFRHFWMESRMADSDQPLNDKSTTNQYPLIPLNTYPCTPTEFQTKMNNFPHFDGNSPKVDGILFYHREGFYSRGETPLVGWLKPYMLPEILGNNCIVANEYILDRPEDYENCLKFMENFDNEIRRRSRRNEITDVPMDEPTEEGRTVEITEITEDDAQEENESDPEERYNKLVEVEMDD